MKKTLIIISSIAAIAGGCGRAKKQTGATGGITVEDFVGKWKTEYIHNPDDLTDDLINCRFELHLEKDTTKANSLKGWHCSVVRGGRQMDCVDKGSGEEPSLCGYLQNDTVYLYLVSSFGGEGQAKLYFDKAAQDRSAVIWKLEKYEYENEDFMPDKKILTRKNENEKQ